MRSLLHRSRWKYVYCISSVLLSWVFPGYLCTAGAQPEVTRRSLTEIYSSGRLWLDTRELGIHKCTMHGVFETQAMDLGGNPMPKEPPGNVTYAMDLWYRLKTNETHAMIRGFGHFNPQPPSVRMRYMKTVNGLMYNFKTQLFLVDSQTGSEYSLNLLSPDRVAPPFHTYTVSMRSFDVHATVPLSTSYHIKVEDDGWQQLCHVAAYQEHPRAPWLPLSRPVPVTEAGRLAAKSTTGTAFVTTLQYPFGLPTSKLAPVYYSYAQYHNWIGFAAVIFYVRDDYMHDMLQQDIIRQGIEERILFIVRWDDIPPFPLSEQIYDQHLLTQHSSLAHWGEDTMVFHADLDEFLVLVDPEGGNLADLQLAGCFKNVSQALFHLDDVGADECGDTHEMDCFNPGLINPGSSFSQTHGLEHYNKTRAESTSWPKVMVHPDKTYAHHVHDSLDLPGYTATAIDPGSCARGIHLLNLFDKRWKKSLYPKLTVPFPDSYFWALTQHAAFWQPDDSEYSPPGKS